MTGRARTIAWLCLPALLGAQPAEPPPVLPEAAVQKLAASLAAAQAHARHVWRDTPPTDPDERIVNAYIEIPRGERRKFEFAMAKNARAVDRVVADEIGGYPVNYGFVPQTISYDGDPFDALVLGPALPGGRIVRGRIVGLMLMTDEKGIDSKVVLSPAGGAAAHALTDDEKQRIAHYFASYKRLEPGGFSTVPGWGSPGEGLAHVRTTHAFFLRCRAVRAAPCRI